MKIYTPIGSKERLVEIFQKVNKVQLNEGFGQNYNPNSVLELAFEEFKSDNLTIKHSNTQVNGSESFVELMCTDRGNNNITFTFKAISNEGDQDGVYSIDSVILYTFTFDAANEAESVEMDENALKQFNAQHANELIDIVSEYVDVESEESADSLYEDAIKKIDSYPFGGGNERMQTGKAYADEKPTNPAVRVKAPELDKYVTESDYDEPILSITDFDDQMIKKSDERIAKRAALNVDEKLKLTNKQVDNVELTKLIRAEIVRLNRIYTIAGLNEEDTAYPNPIPEKFKPKSQYRKKKRKPQTTVKLDETSDRDKYENVVFLQGDEAYEPLERLDREGEDAALEYLKQWHYPGEHEGSQTEGHGTDDKVYRKDGYIMSWNPRLNYIGLQYDMSLLNEPTMDEGDEEPNNDGISLEPENDEVEQLAQDKEETGEMLQGGKGDEKSPLEFDSDQVLKGMEVEMEHSDNPMIALEIVMDHLSEDPEYYTVKDTPEASAQAGASKDANKGTEDSEDKEIEDILLGFKPHNVGDEVEGNEETEESPEHDAGETPEEEKIEKSANKEDELGESKESDIKKNDPATWHQIQIAKKTIRMPNAMAGVMGGMSKEEAKRILTQRGIKFEEN